MSIPEDWSSIIRIVAWSIPSTLALAALLTPRRASLACSAALGFAAVYATLFATAPGREAGQWDVAFLKTDGLTCVMLLLVSGLGAVIARYSEAYLAGEQGTTRYRRWLLLTLSAVTCLVVTDNLLVVAVAWTATSVALHQLLTFYAHRTAAAIAAHKKFLVSRSADVCLVGSLLLIHHHVGSFDFDDIERWTRAQSGPTLFMDLAAVLLVLAVALRSAQLPFHGWLTQVMEAPTPVSALLHAGVVNVGGFVLIRLSTFVEHARLAQPLLLAIGLVSAVLASLVMTTRVSIKVALAWSTCAQMGFMLVECGLGMWDLALLHLLAHSLYKAHAFLAAGSTVESWRAHANAHAACSLTWRRLAVSTLAALLASSVCVVVAQKFTNPLVRADVATYFTACLVALALAPLLARGASNLVSLALSVGRLVMVVAIYLGAHAAASAVVASEAHQPSWPRFAVAELTFLALFVVKSMLQVSPNGPLARAMYPWLFAGLHLDERFTRMTFRLWPPPPEVRLPGQKAKVLHTPLEVQT